MPREYGPIQTRTPIADQLDPIKSGAFQELEDDYYKWRAENTAEYLQLCQKLGYIDLETIQTIIEFGAGGGASTTALAQLAELNGGSVIALEKDRDAIRKLKKLIAKKQLPTTKVIEGDGIVSLRKMYDRGETGDLVIASLLGPDFEGFLTRRLIEPAGNVLNPKGSLLIISDPRTMEAAQNAFAARGIEHTTMSTGTPPHYLAASRYLGHSGLIASRSQIQQGLLRGI